MRKATGKATMRVLIEDAADRRERFREQMEAADKEYWQLIDLAANAGASYRQLADVAGVSPQTVMRRIGHKGPAFGRSPLDVPVGEQIQSGRSQHPGADKKEGPS